MASKPEVNLDLAEEFCDHWSTKQMLELHPDLTLDTLLTYLEHPDVVAFIDSRSQRLVNLYSRMPKQLYLLKVMDKLSGPMATATEFKAVMDAFIGWFRDAAPPSDREFARQLMQAMGIKEDGQ